MKNASSFRPLTWRSIAGVAALAAVTFAAPSGAQDRRAETLVVANEFGPNSLDIHTVGANRPSYGVSWVATTGS